MAVHVPAGSGCSASIAFSLAEAGLVQHRCRTASLVAQAAIEYEHCESGITMPLRELTFEGTLQDNLVLKADPSPWAFFAPAVVFEGSRTESDPGQT